MNLEQNYFTLFSLNTQFAIDSDQLKQRFLTLQRQYHPDKYAHATPLEQRLAAQFSAHLNTAYSTLNDPVARASHMLALAGVEVGTSANTTKDVDFLMEQIEIRESIEQAKHERDVEMLSSLLQKVSSDYQECRQSFAESYSDDINVDARRSLISTWERMQFYQKLSVELKNACQNVR